MRILIDTNVLISAILNPKGTPFQAYLKAVSFPNHALICDQNIEELRRIFNKKFPKRIDALNRFLSIALLSIEIVQIPTDETDSESLIPKCQEPAFFILFCLFFCHKQFLIKSNAH